MLRPATPLLQFTPVTYEQLRFPEPSDERVSDPKLVTIPEAARLLSVGRTTLYELIARGEIEVVHIGRSARVPLAAIHMYVHHLRNR